MGLRKHGHFGFFLVVEEDVLLTGFVPCAGLGLGFVVDAGLMIGRFKTDYSTSMVGKQGITQADVDAEVAKVRDSVRKISVVPKLSVGMSYAF